jgi:hypothetical protein
MSFVGPIPDIQGFEDKLEVEATLILNVNQALQDLQHYTLEMRKNYCMYKKILKSIIKKLFGHKK